MNYEKEIRDKSASLNLSLPCEEEEELAYFPLIIKRERWPANNSYVPRLALDNG